MACGGGIWRYPWVWRCNNHKSVLSGYASRPSNDLTLVTERSSGRRQRLFGNCTFNIESIPICDVGAPIHVTKAALDHIEVAIHQDDSSGVPNT